MLQMVSHQAFESTKKDPQRIKKTDRSFVDNLDYSGFNFPVSIKQYNKSENRTMLTSMFLVMKKGKFSQSMSQKKFHRFHEFVIDNRRRKKSHQKSKFSFTSDNQAQRENTFLHVFSAMFFQRRSS